MDYTDAVSILEKCGKQFENPVYWGVDLSSEHERYLAEEHFKAPVVVKNYPKDIKAFYMRLNEDGKTVAAMDVPLRESVKSSVVLSVKSVWTYWMPVCWKWV